MISKTQSYRERLFEKEVMETPGATVRSYENERITDDRLKRRVDEIAGTLIARGIRPGDHVAAVFCSPLETETAIHGIVKAGGVFITQPYAGNRPEPNINELLETGGARYVLTDKPGTLHLKDGVEIIAIENDGVKNTVEQLEEKTRPRPQEQDETQPMTVIVQHGSKGKTEAISLSYRHIANWIDFNVKQLKIDFSRTLYIVNTRMEQSFPLWLANRAVGGEVHYHRWDGETGINRLEELQREKNFTSVVAPLHVLQEVAAKNKYPEVFPEHLSNIVTMGEEEFNADRLKAYLKERKIRWHNYYGYPEITMITTLAEDAAGTQAAHRHIGKLAPETDAFILGNNRKLVSKGMSGELNVNGKGVMDNYYEDEPLNRDRYREITALPGKRLYKTGITARWLPDWKIAVTGSIDNRCNVNGIRIAMETVETALLKHPAVNDAVVAPVKTAGGKIRLVAYQVQDKDHDDETGPDIEETLKNYLPEELLPIGIVRLHNLPRTAEGRVDREYLQTLGRFDTHQVKKLEREIEEIPQIERAAVTVEEKIDRPVPLHIKDYLPKQRPPDAGDRKDAVENAAAREQNVGDHRPAIIHGAELIWNEGEPRTLAEALERAARQHGDNGIRYIHNDGTVNYQTYVQLEEEARRVMTGLRELGLKPQDKVIFQFNRQEDFVSAFWGCTMAGVVPVPIMVPKNLSRPNNETDTLKRVWELLDKPVVLTNNSLETTLGPIFEDFRLEKIEALRDNEPGKDRHHASPDDMAIILFTSGSTGIPKGVVQLHRTIIAREKSVTRFNNGSPGDVSMNWMPLEHVGGVVMFHVNDVYMGCRQLQVTTEYILTDPLRWLDIIDKYKCTITWAPNFAYGLVNDKVEKKTDGEWDLSTMRFILNGGEAINANSSKKFLELLAPYGLPADSMKPSWGMSETCSGNVYSYRLSPEPGAGVHNLDKYSLTGTVRTSENDADNIRFTQLGKPIPGVTIRIADNNNREVNEREVGKLQIKGATVTPGYYKNPELNKEVFTADGWFDTGDLAFIQNESMTITGRAKDVIIVNGINLNSVEIEAAIEEVEGVETSFTAAAAVRDDNGETDRIAVFYNSQYTDFNWRLNQIKQIKKAFVEKFGLNLDYVIPVEKEDIPKTSIGKIQRLKLARAFQEGAYDDVVKQIDIGLENENTIPSWFFKKVWRRHPIRHNGDGNKNGARTVLLFDEGTGMTGALAARLEKENSRIIRVKHGTGFNVEAENAIQIDRREAGDYRRLMETLQEKNRQIDDIFHLYALETGEETGDHSGTAVDRMKEIQAKGLTSLMYLIQAMNAVEKKENENKSEKRLFVVTSNAHAATATAADGTFFEHAAISGFLRSAALELNWLRIGQIDLDRGRDPEQWETHAGNLVKEWKQIGPHPQEVAYREGKRLKPSLARIEMDKEELRDIPVKKGGIYMVTGGLGGIGILVSKWLQENGDAKLLLIGKTALPEREQWNDQLNREPGSVAAKRIRALIDLENAGGEYYYAAGNIADETFLEQAVRQAETKWQGRLAGVFHLAGMGNLQHHWKQMDKRRVVNETLEQVDQMFQAKVYGTMALHKVLENHKDAAFIGFSSTTGYFGSATFSVYAAANSFLDGYSQYRRAAGNLDTYSIDWGSWDNVGMSENNPEPMIKAMQANGYEMIQPRRGITSMAIALRLKEPQVYVGLNSTNAHIRLSMDEYPSRRQVVHVYCTTQNNAEIDEMHLRDTVLPVIAAYDEDERAQVKIRQIEEIPMKNGGKIDYKQLQDIAAHRGGESFEDELPQTETEQKMAKIWRELLGKSQIGVNDNFFELGGHSLKATVLGSKIHKEFDVIMPLDEIFRNPTIKEMARNLESKTAGKKRYVSIEPAEKRKYYPLSSAQKRLFILHRMEPQSLAYNLFQSVPLTRDVDMERVEQVFRKLVRRHESFRTAFTMENNEPVQQVYERVEFEIQKIDHAAGEENKIESTINEHFIGPFDLARPPLMKAGVVRIGGEPRLLIIETHHIITDGTSQQQLEKEFAALMEDPAKELTPLPIQYKDFAVWQSREEQIESMKQEEDYWCKALAGELPVLHLPTDYPRPRVQSFEGSSVTFLLTEQETQTLKQVAKEADATLFMTLLAVYTQLLSKLSGQDDIIVGSPVAARTHADLQQIIGMFVNTLALRNYPTGEKSFIHYLREVKKRTLRAFENQDFPFEELVDKLEVRRDTGRNPIFDVMFNLLNMREQTGHRSLEIDGSAERTPADTYDYVRPTSIFDLNLTAVDQGKQLLLNLEYCTDLFKESTVERIIGYFRKIITLLTGDVDRRLSELEIITGEEKKRLLYDFNETAAEYPEAATLHGMFEEQAARIPGQVALIGPSMADGGREDELSYRQLNDKSNRLAQLLRAKGIGAGKIVGIVTERSVEMIVGIMAILKAGGAYLPFEPDYPEERVNYIMEESAAAMVLNHDPDVQAFFGGNGAAADTIPERRVEAPQDPAALAYVIYTSGSTGTPKGVAVEHRSAVNIIDALHKKYPLGENDTYLLKTPCVFDVSVSELFGWYPGGGRLAVLETGAEKDPQKITEAIQRSAVTHVNFVPSMFRVYVDWMVTGSGEFGKLITLKYIFLAGEALAPREVDKFRQQDEDGRIRLENIYGPTEGTVYAAQYSLSEWDGGTRIPIGKPMQNVKLYILDQWNRIQPQGVPGELCIGGAGVARGYINNPELTAQRFTETKASGSGGSDFIDNGRYYRTGDLARWLPDGNIEYLGRIDHQVKIRGFRIEPGEIEHQLAKHDGIKEALVVIRQRGEDDNYLCAYIIPVTKDSEAADMEPEHKPSISQELREYLTRKLPAYMIPSFFVEIEKIPYTPSGKVDRKALPEPDHQRGVEYRAPRDEVEETLTAIWAELLGHPKENISIDADFFALGGHSLKGIMLTALIRKELGVALQPTELFKTTTIEGLASLINVYKWAEKQEVPVESNMEEMVI